MTMMKVLFTLINPLHPNGGGVQRTTCKLGKHFTENGLEVSYYSTAQNGHADIEYGKLYHADAPGGVNNEANMQRLTALLKDWRPDIIINQMPYERPLTDTLAKHKGELGYVLIGCLRNSLFSVINNIQDAAKNVVPRAMLPFVRNKVGTYLMTQHHRRNHAGYLRHILDQHDKYVLLAPPNREEMNYFIGDYKSDKVLAIPNNIPSVLSKVPKKEKIILHVGGIGVAQKRSDLLLPFWEACYEKLPDWEFVIVGDGPLLPVIKEKIEQRKIPRVRLEGRRAPESYYKRAAIFMMPSSYEGFPNTILEAQSHACAVLAFNSYVALNWIVNDGKDALLSRPFDSDQMAQQTVNLVNDENKLRNMQEQALKNASRFTIDRVGKEWFKLFDQLQVNR